MTADCAFGWCIEYCPDIYQIQVNSIYTLIEYDKFVIEYKQNIQCKKSCIEYWEKKIKTVMFRLWEWVPACERYKWQSIYESIFSHNVTW